MSLPAEHERHSFAEYLTWDEKSRAEMIGGEIFMMSSPLRVHQEILMELSRQLANFLEGKKCRVYPAPFAVRLFEKDGDAPENIDTVVEPDISVVCDQRKLDRHGCKGAPDFIIEILSPSTRRHDRIVKVGLYQQAGVKEYWIVSPDEQSVLVLLRDGNGSFRLHEEYGKKDIAKVNSLEGCFIELCRVFPDQTEE